MMEIILLKVNLIVWDSRQSLICLFLHKLLNNKYFLQLLISPKIMRAKRILVDSNFCKRKVPNFQGTQISIKYMKTTKLERKIQNNFAIILMRI
jgi:hypothetical protein